MWSFEDVLYLVDLFVPPVLQLIEVLPQVDVLDTVLVAVPITSYRELLLLVLGFVSLPLSSCLLLYLCFLVLRI